MTAPQDPTPAAVKLDPLEVVEEALRAELERRLDALATSDLESGFTPRPLLQRDQVVLDPILEAAERLARLRSARALTTIAVSLVDPAGWNVSRNLDRIGDAVSEK